MNDRLWVRPQDELKHYGILRESGRYPWGSGGTEYQRSMDFYAFIESIKRALGLAGEPVRESEIAKAIGLELQQRTGDPKAKFTVADIRDTKTIAKEEIVKYQTDRAKQLKDKGVSIKEIAKDLDIPQPTVRLRLKNYDNLKQSQLRNTMDMVRKNVDEHFIVDIGKGSNLNIDAGTKMGISPEKLRSAVSGLRDEGYRTYNLQVPQGGAGRFTNQLVIVPPGTTFGEAARRVGEIHTMGEWTENDGEDWSFVKTPVSINPKRVEIVHSSPEDGVVYVRPGVKDLDMGKNTYAQVRIMVNNTHFIKGIAIRKEGLPEGVDLQVHSNKKKGTPMLGDKNNSVLKPKVEDESNPFGSVIKRQIMETGKDGVERVKSALNLMQEEGEWDDWRKSMPAQLLGKQPHSFIKSQLATTREQTQMRLDEINQITNAVVRKDALNKFAEAVDSDAVDLRAAQMPRQQTRLIVPFPKMRKGEIYAPTFETGEKVVLIRYPHGGRFEIPEVTVNNNNRTAKQLLGNAPDAIGIHPDVAERLSGADFDGDTVVVIPNRAGLIKGHSSASKVFDDNLQGYNPKDVYGGYEEKDGKGNFKLMTQTGREMGIITNLITDMQIQNARPEHIVRAVKHSMVVIDAEKHKLDYQKSAEQNGIRQLVELYQSHPDEPGRRPGGASTLVSRATAKERMPELKERPAAEGGRIDPNTGAKVLVPKGNTRSAYDPKTQTYDPDVKVPVTKKYKRLAVTDDARTLVRDPADPVERLYADHANEMKAIANRARLEAYRTPNPTVNKRAKEVYAPEVAKLIADRKAAEAQKPLDRRAQIYANEIVKAKRQEDPLLRTDDDRRKKVERQAIATSRARLGLVKPEIEITDRQWDAIQSGAVSASELQSILKYANPKRVSELAMPRTNAVMTTAVSARAKAMLAAGVAMGDVAAALGIPLGTLKSAQSRGDV